VSAYGLVLAWVLRVFSSFRFLYKFIHSLRGRCSVVLVLNGMNFQRMENGVPIAEKVVLIKKSLCDAGIRTMLCLHPFGVLPQKITRTDFVSFEFLSPLIPPKWIASLRSEGNGVLSAIQKDTFFPRWQLNLWRIFLTIVRPRTLIGIGLDETLVSLCKDLNIQTIEVQHGAVSEVFPYPPTRITNPDYFLAWTNADARIVKSCGVRAIVSGFPYNFKDLSVLERRPRLLTTLITLSYNEVPSVDPFGFINLSLLPYLDYARDKDHRIIFRLHPTWRYGLGLTETKHFTYNKVRKYFAAQYPNAILRDPFDFPLYEDLAGSDVHVTHGSSATLEASLLGTPTIITNAIFDSSYYSEIAACNLLYHVKNKSISDIFRELLKNKNFSIDLPYRSAKLLDLLSDQEK
jgi:hypothetical protein